MVDFSRLKTTLTYARLGLISLSAAIAPITGTAQELCGTQSFAGESDADSLMNNTLAFLDTLESNGVVAFEGIEGRMSIESARQALQDGVGSLTLLACVVEAASFEFADRSRNRVIICNASGALAASGAGGGSSGSTTGRLFCTSEVAEYSVFLGSES